MADSIFDRLVAIKNCLSAQIVTDGLCDVAFCGIVPGEAAAGDYFQCGSSTLNGMAWVRLSTSYMASSVGQADLSIGNCTKEIGVDIEIGIMRCAALASVSGSPPKPSVVHEAAAQQLADMETLFRTVTCCPEVSSRDYVIGSYAPLGPEGGIVGGILTISLIFSP